VSSLGAISNQASSVKDGAIHHAVELREGLEHPRPGREPRGGVRGPAALLRPGPLRRQRSEGDAGGRRRAVLHRVRAGDARVPLAAQHLEASGRRGRRALRRHLRAVKVSPGSSLRRQEEAAGPHRLLLRRRRGARQCAAGVVVYQRSQ